MNNWYNKDLLQNQMQHFSGEQITLNKYIKELKLSDTSYEEINYNYVIIH